MIIKDKYIYSCRSRMERIIFDKHHYNSMKSGCSSSSLDALCIRSVFNVSFSHRFMGGYLTQIWSIYVHFSPRSHFNRHPFTDNSRFLLSLGCETRLRLFWHISSSLLLLLFPIDEHKY